MPEVGDSGISATVQIRDQSVRHDSIEDWTDEALLEGFASGNPHAAQVLVRRFTPMLLRMATITLGNRPEAEEVVQDTMLRLWKYAPGWQSGKARVSTWLWRVASNLCVDRLRRRRSVDLDSVPEPESDEPSAIDVLESNDRVDALRIALASLPQRQKMVLIMRHIEELSNPRIAEILDTSVEAVESLSARGMRKMRESLGSQREKLGWGK